MAAPRRETILQGFTAGVVLFLTVALFFAGVNLLLGRPALHTVELLGRPLLGPAPDPLAPSRRWAAVGTFSGIHLVGSLLLGVAAVLLFRAMERTRRAWSFFLFFFVVGSVATILGLQILTAEASQVLPWRSVVTAHLAGAVTTTGYLLWARVRVEGQAGT
jgi:hypothetical protein